MSARACRGWAAPVAADGRRARQEEPPGHRRPAHLAEYERNHRLREALS